MEMAVAGQVMALGSWLEVWRTTKPCGDLPLHYWSRKRNTAPSLIQYLDIASIDYLREPFVARFPS